MTPKFSKPSNPSSPSSSSGFSSLASSSSSSISSGPPVSLVPPVPLVPPVTTTHPTSFISPRSSHLSTISINLTIFRKVNSPTLQSASKNPKFVELIFDCSNLSLTVFSLLNSIDALIFDKRRLLVLLYSDYVYIKY